MITFPTFVEDNKTKLWYAIYGFLVLAGLPLANYIVFRHGWTNVVTSWFWIVFEPILALAWAFLCQLPIWAVSRKREALRALATYFVIFSLSGTAIIYGWGMHPQNWYVIIVFYVIACFLPPFDQVSYSFWYWSREKDDKEIDLLRRERTELRIAIMNYENAIESGNTEHQMDCEFAARAASKRADELRERLANLD